MVRSRPASAPSLVQVEPLARCFDDGAGDEPVQPLPYHLQHRDPWLGAVVRPLVDGTAAFEGTVISIDYGTCSRERLYLVQFTDGDVMHFTRSDLDGTLL